MKTASPRPQTRRGRRALTLVEVLVSLIISVTMFMGIISLLQFNFIYQNQQELRANAMDAMAHHMEVLKQQFMWEVEPASIFISDNRTPDNADDDTIGRLTVRLFDRDGTELTEAPRKNFDRVKVVMTVTWRGRGRLSATTFHERLVGFIIP